MIEKLLSHIEKTIARYISNWDDSKDPADMEPATSGQQQQRRSIVINVEEFIGDVENRPAIWNRNYHCNKSFLEKTWDELSAKYNLPKTTLKTKWKGLRDNFRVEYKKIPRNELGQMLIPPEQHESKWTHYYSLLFLVTHMRHRNPLPGTVFHPYLGYPQLPQQQINLQDSGDDDYEETLVEPDLTTGLITIEDDDDDNDDDDDYKEVDSKTDIQTAMNLSKRAPYFQRSIEAIETSSNDSAIFSTGGGGGGHKNRKESYAASSSTISSTSVDSKPPSSSSSISLAKAGNRKRSRDDDIELRETNFTTDASSQGDPDDDYYYLLSLLPYMKQMNASQKLRLRTKIQKLIFKELYKEDIDEVK